MLSSDYFDWSQISGWYLRNYSHLERFQTYEKLISPAGLNVVIVADFLKDNPEPLNVVQWRSANVYEIGEELTLRLKYTCVALNAIGATRTPFEIQYSFY